MIQVHSLFDPATNTLTYVVWSNHDAVIIDPVLNYVSGERSSESLELLRDFVTRMNLTVHWILETHAHADHLTSARELRALWPSARWAMSERLSEVFNNFKTEYKWPASLQLKDLSVDRWLFDGEEFYAGQMKIGVIATPGHTPACVTYRIGDNLFTCDALMTPDSGTGRCDFPGGSASALYNSIWKKLYALPDHLRAFVGHDYKPGGRHLRPHASLGEHKRSNIHLRLGTPMHEFVQFRESRDRTLNTPKLIEPSLDWNLGAHQRVPR